MKKNKILRSALVLLSVAFVSGCTNNNGNNHDHTTDADIADLIDENGLLKEETSITLWSTTGTTNQVYLNNYIEDFKTVQPNIKVESNIIGGNYNTLKDNVIKGFTSNAYPDLAVAYPDHVAEYINYNKAVKLDKYIYDENVGWSDEDLNDLIPNYVKEGQDYGVSGTYSVPYCKSSEQLFYNEDVLIGMDLSAYDKTINNGRPLDKNYIENLTWDELFDKLCPAIVAHDESVSEEDKYVKTTGAYHAVFAYDSDDNLFITLAKQYGYGYTSYDKTTGIASVDFNNDGMKNVLRKFNDAAKKGYIISKGSAGNTYTNTYFTAQGTLFSVGSTGGVGYQYSSSNPMNVGVARIPQANLNKTYVINQGPSLALLDHGDANKTLASWLFYKYLASKEVSLDWTLNTGYSPIRSSSFDTDKFIDASDYENKDDKTSDRLMALSKYFMKNDDTEMFFSPAFKGSSTCRDQAGGLMTKALTTSNNIDDIDTWFSDAVNECKLAL